MEKITNAGERCELEGGSLFGKKGFSKSTDSLSIVTGKTFMKWRRLVKGRSFGISLIYFSIYETEKSHQLKFRMRECYGLSCVPSEFIC